ncbi:MULTISPECIES: D-2-hydroxyacid dehydrogenase [unclassified Romboutsia]|uniref:D-2-hydroxyacid dehydrogenase n=1 Tax=unclassified Romboutsia TaxID=2626894 RepID=UPI000821EAAC|nr:MULTISPECIES: D-2-hydroxyacid dehydrogenase [unclassified Romboutsia]SCH43290.1 Putative 2-hydroxyacid dehydrogenase HI_1556 [uncultured Clostridium sp.]
MFNILVLLPLDDEKKLKLNSIAADCKIVYSSQEKVTKKELEDANIIIGNPDVDIIRYSNNLKWIQLNSAGADKYIKEGVLNKDVILTNATGAYGLAVSEHMLAMLLELLKKLHLYRDNQNKKIWKSEGKVKSINKSRILIVGLGDIGCSFGKMVKSLGAYTIGVKRRNTLKPEFIDELHLIDNLDELLPSADIVAICLPSTKDTQDLFSKSKIEKMKKGSILLNVGRGNTVDTESLCDALENNHLGGAGLDVIDPEPLPSEHRIWDLENIVITPHVAGGYNLDETYENIFEISINNLERFINGKKLCNIVDFSTGYVE